MATEPTTNRSASSSPVNDDSGKRPVVSVHEAASNLVDEEEQQVNFSDILFRKRKRLFDPDTIATKRSVFDDPVLAQHYWPKKDYENIHRLDPSARWTYREERALVRKIDWKIMLLAAIVFSALNLDRFNLSQANSASFLADLGLTTDATYRF